MRPDQHTNHNSSGHASSGSKSSGNNSFGHDDSTDDDAGHVATQLRAMRRHAPEDLMPNVLVEVGLADQYISVSSEIGELFVAYNDTGVSACVPAGDPAEFEEGFADAHGRPVVAAMDPPRRLLSKIERTLESGKLGSLPVDLSHLTEFQQLVLLKTAQIPRGEIRPYSWVAKEIDRPGAVRAVGSALAGNPIPVLIPCHRVVRADGKIGNYAFGPEMKRELLTVEGLDPDAVEAEAERGVRYTGTPNTHIYCHPTCRHARRTLEKNTVRFRSAIEASVAGYRPCKVCRPAAA